jgi:aryl-alcohol dehydrogenase-like predicted oxidoreductase
MAPQIQPDRQLGRTGVRVPPVGYGTAPLGKDHIAPEHAERCLDRAIDLGVTYIDTSPDYGSEPKIGPVMRRRRNEVFLATKINKRSKESVLEELKGSLQRLQTDHVDLVQVHAINAWADLEQALAPDGALAGLEQARQEGLTRFIGITGHARPDILAYALEQYPFDTVLSALGIADRLVSHPEATVLPKARERQAGVIAMKVLGHGTLQSREAALRYSLGLPGVSLAIIGMDKLDHIEQIVGYAASYRPLEDAELDHLIDEAKQIVKQDAEENKTNGKSPLFWLHDTQVMGWKEQDEPNLVAY